MEIAITREDYSADELRALARSAVNGVAGTRMLALALILDGKSRTEAAHCCGMDRQTLRDWVHRYNDEGLDGLYNRPGQGRKSLLSRQQEQELAEIVRDLRPSVAQNNHSWCGTKVIWPQMDAD